MRGPYLVRLMCFGNNRNRESTQLHTDCPTADICCEEPAIRGDGRVAMISGERAD